MFEKLLRVEDLSVAYGSKRVIRDVNFSVKLGEILVIAGESGSGKSECLERAEQSSTGKFFSTDAK